MWPWISGPMKRCKQPRLWCVLEPCLAWESSFALGRSEAVPAGAGPAMPTWFRTDALHGYAVRPPANGLQRVLYSQLPAFRIVRRPSR